MSNIIEDFKQQFARRAICLEIGGFHPSTSPAASWFGRVNLAAPGEIWPVHQGVPLHALAQINLTEMPFRPPRLDDLDFITVFVKEYDLPISDPNGSKWLLRAYRSLNHLVPLQSPEISSGIKPFPMRPIVIEQDMPSLDAFHRSKWDSLFGAYETGEIMNIGGFKLGGWPTLVQSEIDWPWDIYPFRPEYVFQIDSTEKGNWMWGDSGVGYFGRGTTPGHLDQWALEWQCY